MRLAFLFCVVCTTSFATMCMNNSKFFPDLIEEFSQLRDINRMVPPMTELSFFSNPPLVRYLFHVEQTPLGPSYTIWDPVLLPHFVNKAVEALHRAGQVHAPNAHK